MSMFRQMHKLLIFNDEKLLYQALTHRSYINEHFGTAGDNERLEFFGDAILSFISGEYLYNRHPQMGEGEMTRRRAVLVDENQLAKFASEVGLESQMRLGNGARLEGGSRSPNLLSSTFEAIVGAYYLDKGCNIEAIRYSIYELFDSVHQGASIGNFTIDPKSEFQIFVQKNGTGTLPKYVTERIGGEDHRPEFSSKVYIGDILYAEGKGGNKKQAQKQAAELALTKYNRLFPSRSKTIG
jgi:ribonuclease III